MTCSVCAHFDAKPDADDGFCRRFPPAATAILVPRPPSVSSPGGGMAIQTLTIWPSVPQAGKCGEFRSCLLS